MNAKAARRENWAMKGKPNGLEICSPRVTLTTYLPGSVMPFVRAYPALNDICLGRQGLGLADRSSPNPKRQRISPPYPTEDTLSEPAISSGAYWPVAFWANRERSRAGRKKKTIVQQLPVGSTRVFRRFQDLGSLRSKRSSKRYLCRTVVFRLRPPPAFNL